jgi:dienelactone hydrolase
VKNEEEAVMTGKLFLAVACVMAVESSLLAQTPRPGVSATASGKSALEDRIARWRLKGVPGSGPYSATRTEDPALPTHTIYRPADLSKVAGKVPIVAFGNGGCRNTSVEFTAFLAELASRGYLIVAQGRNDVLFAMGDYSLVSNGYPVQEVNPAVLTKGVDWAIAENNRAASPYYNKLDTSKIAYAGQSCGGRQALSASVDPRTTTTVVLNSGYPAPGERPSVPTSKVVPTVAWSQLHAPVAFFAGGPADSAYARANANFAETPLPAFKAHLGVGHIGAYDAETPDIRWVKAVAGWLDWQLKEDRAARALFVGPKCGLCVDPDWSEVEAKRLR